MANPTAPGRAQPSIPPLLFAHDSWKIHVSEAKKLRVVRAFWRRVRQVIGATSMSVNDPEFYQPSKVEPSSIAPAQGRGCFFYGCVFAGVGFILMVTLCGAGTFFMYRFASSLVTQYTGTTPLKLPKVEVSEEKQAELRDRVEAFRKALDSGEETPPLVLTSNDVNALIEQSKEFKDKIFITLEKDKIKGQISLPLDAIGENVPIFGPMVRGRYLNGEAELNVLLKDGVPTVTLEDIEVNGKHLPDEVMTNLRQENLAKDALKDRKNAEMLRKLESVELEDGKLIIKARPKDKRTPASDDAKPLPDSPFAEPGPASNAPSSEKTAVPAPSPSGAETAVKKAG